MNHHKLLPSNEESAAMIAFRLFTSIRGADNNILIGLGLGLGFYINSSDNDNDTTGGAASDVIKVREKVSHEIASKDGQSRADQERRGGCKPQLSSIFFVNVGNIGLGRPYLMMHRFWLEYLVYCT